MTHPVRGTDKSAPYGLDTLHSSHHNDNYPPPGSRGQRVTFFNRVFCADCGLYLPYIVCYNEIQPKSLFFSLGNGELRRCQNPSNSDKLQPNLLEEFQK